jgi:hypothetical protein
MYECACATLTGTDPTSCCPIYKCGTADPTTGKCN